MKLHQALLLASVSAILLWLVPDSWPKHITTLAHGLAEALAIAVFLAITVDGFVKKRLAEEIVKDVSPHIAAAALPQEIREEIHNISTILLYREELLLDFIMEKIVSDDGSTRIAARTNSKSRMKNLSSDAAEHWFSVEVQKKSEDDGPHILKVKADNIWANKQKSPISINEAAIGNKDLGVDGESGGTRIYKKLTFIPPKETATFEYKLLQEFAVEHADVFVSIYATNNIDISFQYPDDISVNLIFAHRHREEVEKTDEGAPAGWRKTRWRFTRGMLPYQPIIYQFGRANGHTKTSS